MAKNNNQNIQKLLEYWGPPKGIIEPIGCIATSFTFDSDFFEEQCLSRFVKMESDANSDGPAYLIEREEKFAKLKCASVLVDVNHCSGKRSLRWDLLPFKSGNGILHAKISLLYWVDYVRIIIGSANLTENGYKKNREIFGVVDFYESSDAPYDFLTAVLEYLKFLINENQFRVENAVTKRYLDFVELVRRNSRKWGRERNFKKNKDIAVHTLFTKNNTSDVLEQLKDLWGNYDSRPPKRACITSPFFDSPDSQNLPVKKIWRILNQRGNAEVEFNIVSKRDGSDHNKVILYGPESLNYTPENRSETCANFRLLEELDITKPYRPLHMKSILLENENWYLYLIGSSNFTSAGLSLGNQKNYEANLVYVVNKSTNREGKKLIESAQLKGKYIDENKQIQWLAREDEDKSNDDKVAILHKAFKSVSLNYCQGKYVLELNLDTDKIPKFFLIYDELLKYEIYNSDSWIKSGKPADVEIEYNNPRPPSGLFVKWDNSNIFIWWPVNILDPSVLPPPEELKNLPLDALLDILSSAKPLHKVLSKWLKKHRKLDESLENGALIDPHKRVNTSAFLLQRTRKISYSLNALKEKLQKPIYTLESLNWRVFGPVGVQALCKAITKTAKSEEEKAFLLTEIVLELSNVEPRILRETISMKEYKDTIQKIVGELKEIIQNLDISRNLQLNDYITNVFKEIEK